MVSAEKPLTEGDIARRSAEEMWRNDAASRMLGLRIMAVGPGTATVAMRVRKDMINGWGMCHGGLIASLADSAFAVACNSRGIVTVAAGFDVQFRKPGRLGDELQAFAVERALHDRSGIYAVTVKRAIDGVTIATFRGRSRSLDRPNPALPAVGSS
jgi:acyl-CoA thioesterase